MRRQPPSISVRDMPYTLGVTEVKKEDIRKGVAQNLVQLELSLTIRKRKRCGDEEEDRCIPLKAYGIVTDARDWYFLECCISQSDDKSSTDSRCPRFRISKLDDVVNYQKSTWKEDAAAVLGRIVWLMRKMVDEIPKRELRLRGKKYSNPRPRSSAPSVHDLSKT
ncbi:hypothetical protein BC939DRAFT_327529 [Gamsiella multidivaricata]|uniref:uncharacterized protein n=1 Tax=Gamsiella multidivaricata TaxID=101098 RepID=UPI00221F86C8|nr:uncharacterized protein BC939DRAFT_327529 [Gamsiella multidivaricata]KAI7817536.1 hypothetical protein BC939DRAFT_327529 [Gamsiella multidivaricata]